MIEVIEKNKIGVNEWYFKWKQNIEKYVDDACTGDKESVSHKRFIDANTDNKRKSRA